MDVKKRIKPIWFLLYINICVGVFISLSSYVNVPLQTLKDYSIYFIHFCLLQLTLFGFTSILLLSKWLFRVVFSICFLLFSSIAFWIFTMDVTVSLDLIQLSLESKPDIVYDLITKPFVIFELFVVLVLLTILFLHTKIVWILEIKRTNIIISFFCVLLFFFCESKKYGVFKRRMPYVFIVEGLKYLNKKEVVFEKIESEIKAKNKLNIVFVLGESVRAKNMQLNGYSRETNPLLFKRKNIYTLQNVYTDNTYTAKSVPQILTSKSIYDTIEKPVYPLYSVLNKVGYNTLWIGNQTPEVSYRDLISQNKDINLVDVEHSVLSYNKQKDGVLLDIFKDKYSSKNSDFYTIHMIGSHWWYEGRYPKKFKKFIPVVNTKYLPSNSHDQMINSYDNTIVYLDYFLNEIISFLEKKNEEIVLIYLSDHGEVLGEDGKWLHGQNHSASKNPASLIWFSDIYKKNHIEVVNSVKKKSSHKITTDFFYNSILGLIDVQSFKYDRNENIFRNNP